MFAIAERPLDIKVIISKLASQIPKDDTESISPGDRSWFNIFDGKALLLVTAAQLNYFADISLELPDTENIQIEREPVNYLERGLLPPSSGEGHVQDRFELDYLVKDIVPAPKSPYASTAGPSGEAQEYPLSPLTSVAQNKIQSSNHEADTGAVQITTNSLTDPCATSISMLNSVDQSTVTDGHNGTCPMLSTWIKIYMFDIVSPQASRFQSSTTCRKRPIGHSDEGSEDNGSEGPPRVRKRKIGGDCDEGFEREGSNPPSRTHNHPIGDSDEGSEKDRSEDPPRTHERKTGNDSDEDSEREGEGTAGTHKRKVDDSDGESEKETTEEESPAADDTETDHHNEKPKTLGYGEFYLHHALHSLHTYGLHCSVSSRIIQRAKPVPAKVFPGLPRPTKKLLSRSRLKKQNQITSHTRDQSLLREKGNSAGNPIDIDRMSSLFEPSVIKEYVTIL